MTSGRVPSQPPRSSPQAAHAAAFHTIDTYAVVTGNRADAGAVATMAEFVCRQLNRKIESLRAEYDQTQ